LKSQSDPSTELLQRGALYVVATPIGNLGDLSERARQVLSSVDRIAAEDTRNSGGLLSHFGIRTPLVALHDHNESQVAAQWVAALQQGQTLALISDAGTPLISDPGYVLVREARAAGCEIIAVPGPCAAIAALSIAGLASDSFVFCGFLPAKSAARRERIAALSQEARTVILYESSHRIESCAKDLADLLGPRKVMLAREITKRFEQSIVCSADALPDWLAADANRLRGEFVLIIEAAQETQAEDAEAERVLRILLAELPAARAAKVAASLTGLKKNALYAMALKISDSPDG
tara:strand:- start:2063 stop:2938 length:876 start_codon:yes stop_codon:yes gene_type:complete